MKVGIITERYPPSVKGGGEISVHLLARELKERGVSVEVLSFDGRGCDVYEGVKVYRVPMPGSNHFPVEKCNLLAYSVIRGFSKDKDLLHGYNMRYYPATAWAARTLGLPCVLTMTTYGFYYPYHVDGLKDPESVLGKLHQRMTDGFARLLIHRGADALVFLSSAQMRIYLEAGFRHAEMTVIPNFVDPQFRKSSSSPSPDSRRIIYAGRLSREKGLETLLRAHAKISNARPDIELIIAGTGPLMEDLKSLAGSLGTERRVVFAGKVAYEDMGELYSAGSVFIHPGVWPEPFGRTILEAMASGVPVIASNKGSAPELLADCGLLFEPEDVGGLASAIDRVLGDGDLWSKLSRGGRERATESFSADGIVNRITELYGTVRRRELSGSRAAGAAGKRVVRDGWSRRFRHRCGRVLDATVVPLVEKAFDGYSGLVRGRGAAHGPRPRRILFVMFSRGVGDAMLMSPALVGTREKHPRAVIAVLASPYVEGLVQRFKAVDQFIPFEVEHARISDVYRISRRLRGLGFDTAVDVLADRSVLASLICFLSGAETRIGFSVGLRRIFLNRRVPLEKARRHFTDSTRDMLIREGLADDGQAVFEEGIRTEEDRQRALSVIGGIVRPVFSVHPGSKGAKQFRWPPERWLALLRLLRDQYGSTFILIGSADEQGLCKYIDDGMNGCCVNTAGRNTIGETAALIGESDMLLSVASGPLHLAVAMHVPAVYIGGGVDLIRWGAYGGSGIHRVVLRNEDCDPENCLACEHRIGTCSTGISPEAFFHVVVDAIGDLDVRTG